MTRVRSRPAGPGPDARIDELMDTASRWLAQMRYFDCERTCTRALALAREARDFERMARICLPLQEARRQRMQIALDAGLVAVASSRRELPRPLVHGCYLVQAPMIGAEARALRELAFARSIPVLIVCREPLTSKDLWPVVAVGEQVLRVRIPPPSGVRRTGKGVTQDELTEPPTLAWFTEALEKLGDEAIARLKPEDPPQWRVDDLLEFLDALPEHEKLHQALEAECRRAIGAPEPEGERRRGLPDNPFCF